MTDTLTTEGGVTTESFEGTIENANGIKLPKALSYIAEYEKLLSFDAIPPKEVPDNDDVLAMVNNARKANARQKAIATALENAAKEFAAAHPNETNPYVKPTMEDSDELKIKSIVAGLVASKKYTQESATALARQMLGLA